VTRTALVTGAATGIGAATARLLAGRGLDVAVNHLGENDLDAALDTARELRASGVRAVVVQGDVGRPDDCRRIVEDTVTALDRLDVLINNAGYTRGRDLIDLDGVDPAEFEQAFAVNSVGPFLLAREAAPHIRACGGGAIVNVASVAGLTGAGSSHPYLASKAALINLTRSLARALGPTIRVNAVCPGLVNTPWPHREFGDRFDELVTTVEAMMVTGRIVDPDDVAGVIGFLALDADQLTGEIVRVDGGMHLK
jgi:3-oxoacyl-[acyl-carrier protein] reductase